MCLIYTLLLFLRGGGGGGEGVDTDTDTLQAVNILRTIKLCMLYCFNVFSSALFCISERQEEKERANYLTLYSLNHYGEINSKYFPFVLIMH